MSAADEQLIRDMVNRAVDRLNKGDATAIAAYGDQDPDYVGVDGALTKGRARIHALFAKLAK